MQWLIGWVQFFRKVIGVAKFVSHRCQIHGKESLRVQSQSAEEREDLRVFSRLECMLACFGLAMITAMGFRVTPRQYNAWYMFISNFEKNTEPLTRVE